MNSLYNLKHRIMEKEEELETIIAAKGGCKRSLEKLINLNILIVYKTAYQYAASHMKDHEHDIIQDGCIGLLKGIEKFDPSLNLRLSTYSKQWIRNEITRNIDKGNFYSMNYPVHHSRAMAVILRAENKYGDVNINNVYDLYLKECEESEIQAVYSKKQIVQSWEFSKTVSFSGDKLYSENEDEDETFFDYISYKDKDDYNELITKDKTIKILHQCISELKIPERNMNILKMRFGIGTGNELTLEEVGKIYGITRERVRQIADVTMEKLKELIINKGYKLEDLL